MKQLLWICLFSFSLLYSSEDLNLSSLSASYNGKDLCLKGNVSLDHALGILSSEEALLEKMGDEAELPFSSAYLEKDVLITLKNGAKLSCQTAGLNFLELTGKLLGNGQQKVIYKDSYKEKNGESLPLEITSQKVDLSFQKQEVSSLDFLYDVNKLVAQEEVLIYYGQDFRLEAQEATYDKNKEQELLKAYPTNASSFCKLSYQGEEIQALQVAIDLKKELLFLKEPQGTLSSSILTENRQGTLHFSCKELFWDPAKGLLTLKKAVEIEESGFGKLTAEKEVRLIQKNRLIESIYIPGKSELSQEKSSLTCFGSLHVDGLKKQITALSPKKDEQVEKQLLYVDEDILITGDQARLEYGIPSSLVIRGNCHLSSTQTKRCALADRLTYSLETKTLVLLASPGKKVLFYDEEQNMTMSAQEVHIIKNPVTGQSEFKGVGNMKLSFSTQEESLLKKAFPSYYSQGVSE